MPNMATVTVNVHNSLREKVRTRLDEKTFTYDLWFLSMKENVEQENYSIITFERPFILPSEAIDALIAMSDEHGMAITTEVEGYTEPTTRHYRNGEELILASA